jgi:hypothetical protein
LVKDAMEGKPRAVATIRELETKLMEAAQARAAEEGNAGASHELGASELEQLRAFFQEVRDTGALPDWLAPSAARGRSDDEGSADDGQ